NRRLDVGNGSLNAFAPRIASGIVVPSRYVQRSKGSFARCTAAAFARSISPTGHVRGLESAPHVVGRCSRLAPLRRVPPGLNDGGDLLDRRVRVVSSEVVKTGGGTSAPLVIVNYLRDVIRVET